MTSHFLVVLFITGLLLGYFAFAPRRKDARPATVEAQGRVSSIGFRAFQLERLSLNIEGVETTFYSVRCFFIRLSVSTSVRKEPSFEESQ